MLRAALRARARRPGLIGALLRRCDAARLALGLRGRRRLLSDLRSPDGRRRLTRELPAEPLIQPFRAARAGLTALCLPLDAGGRPSVPAVHATLLDERGTERAHAVLEAAAGGEFAFAPLADSAGRWFTLRLATPDAWRGHGLAAWCEKPTPDRPALRVRGRGTGGALALAARYADEAAPPPVPTPAPARRVLLITPDVLGARQLGIGLRHLAFARELHRRGFAVTLATPEPGAPPEAPFPVRTGVTKHQARALVAAADVVVCQGDVPWRYRFLQDARVPLVFDLVCPLHLEDLEKPEAFRPALALVQEWLRRGDFFLSAHDAQRDYWLGMLSGAGRVNPLTRHGDPLLERLLAVVPFGIESSPPVRADPPVLRGVRPGIGLDDVVLLWWGGIWDWLDPFAVLAAVERAAADHPALKLLFGTLRRPGGEIPPPAARAQEWAAAHGLLDRHIFFNEWPVPHAERGAWLAEADVGVIAYPGHLETRFSARLRALDHLWAGLPTVTTAGDAFAALVEREGLGLVVPPGDVAAYAEALAAMTAAPCRAACRAATARVAAAYTWERALEPLARFCAAPAPAADRRR